MTKLRGTYDVFLSFRGEDTRTKFTSHLYEDLESSGVDTFRDDEGLDVGKVIGNNLMEAISQSKISIIIFSKRYADSKWCLREVAKIVECSQNLGQKIMPIYYDVEPWELKHCDDVKKKEGSYYDFFLDFQKNPKLDQNEVEQWKNALKTVGKIKGLELRKEPNLGQEGSLVKKIVSKVLFELKRENFNLPDNVVGMDQHLERLNELFLSSSESDGVRMIGILGMSGLGKTTIAKAIFNIYLNEFFDSHSFIHDVHEELQQPNGIQNLQTQHLCKILNRSNFTVHNVDHGSNKIKDAIRNKKVFLVFDNVDGTVDQMSKIRELLIMNHSSYGVGSIIIITTTNKEVLLAIKVQCERDGKSDVYHEYEPPFMGREDAIELFSKCAFKKESPPDDYKDLVKEVIKLAEGLPIVLETYGSLLSIEVNNKDRWEKALDKLREVPREEVTKRLELNYDALDLRQKQIFLDIACFFVGHNVTNPSYMWDACGFHASEGIMALERRSLIKFITDGNVRKMKEVEKVIWMHDQLRKLGKKITNESFASPLERSRLWVHDEALEALKIHPGQNNTEAIQFQFDEPVYVSRAGYLSRGITVAKNYLNWNRKYTYMEVVRLELALYNSSRAPPHGYLSRGIRVAKSYLTDNWEYIYPRLTGQEFQMLPKLRYLSIDNCDLVGDFKGVHTKLKWIRWKGCSWNSTMSNLYLKNIVVLSICESDINYNWKWWNEIKMAEKLKVLNLSNNSYLERTPDLSKFNNLEILDLKGSKILSRVDGLEHLASLISLDVTSCALKTLPDLSKLRKLRVLKMSSLSDLVMIQGLEKLELLEILDVSSCRSLQRLPDLSNLHNLTNFTASDCYRLVEVPGLDELRSLKKFHMVDCPVMKRYPDVSNYKNLTTLVKCFSEVSEVERLGELETLELLSIHSTKCMLILPQLSKLTRLTELEIYECDELIEIRSLEGLKSLKYFRMSYCPKVTTTTFANLKMLQYVKFNECEELTKINGLKDSDSLRVLKIIDCDSIEKLPNLSGLKKLWCIILVSCGKVTEIPGLEQYTSLTRLCVDDCKSIDQDMPSFVTYTYDRYARYDEKFQV